MGVFCLYIINSKLQILDKELMPMIALLQA